ncbi:dTDP-4-dehydrorhamnose 3,5-epimerase [soil metagenome]
MKIELTPVEGVLMIEPQVFGDDRGFFVESWNRRAFAAAGLDLDFVQDNHSRSARGVLRGMHFQSPNPQGKLVRVTQGAVYDAVVDLRASSSTYRQWFGVELSAANKRMLWVPPGLAHGFLTLEDGTDFQYKCTGYYEPQHEHSLLWNDPEIGINWPLDGIEPVLAVKDLAGLRLDDVRPFQ